MHLFGVRRRVERPGARSSTWLDLRPAMPDQVKQHLTHSTAVALDKLLAHPR
ncbi:hypothetical protein MLP_40380 [Microlunatus phosphovorus NM-1]|uniref:Uncharacterized protein n=1 Tax=Microlunatus phosphovorus (strain ATCC 700054 / DSM 10555 / JCM 9379 / NBRC 101784 / NCIMB 13414 / VKM Ac-1990 / NM-1) TaxID=1032480 RepID=F5XR30_MICPN|nr:hypothetical protein MLP_40380 [Microlunatus phosphovorus NM-1]